jgi:hypothetical protein
MANCPNCGSDHIQIIRETNVSWGRAVAGWALFGVVGGAVGAVTGEDRNAISCLNCGTSWKAADLYKTLQVIKDLTNLKLDLSMDNHRDFMNDVIPEITTYSNSISKVDRDTHTLIGEHPGVGVGMFIGYFIGFILLIVIWSKAGGWWGFTFFLFGWFLCGFIGGYIGKFFYGDIREEKRRSKINRDSEQKKSKIQAFFKKQVGQLKKKNNL